jgi:hypothetical protein
MAMARCPCSLRVNDSRSDGVCARIAGAPRLVAREHGVDEAKPLGAACSEEVVRVAVCEGQRHVVR